MTCDMTVTLAIFPNDDPSLSCFFCRSNEHVPRPLAVSLYTTYGRSTFGVHQRCYEAARVPVKMPAPEPKVDRCTLCRDAREPMYVYADDDGATFSLCVGCSPDWSNEASKVMVFAACRVAMAGETKTGDKP